MSLTMHCPRGHQWQSGQASESLASESPASTTCPECGAPGTAALLSSADCATIASEKPAGADLTGLADNATMRLRFAKRPRGELPSIAGYELLGELGRGGMGVVYKARQSRLHRLVALKMILNGAQASSIDLGRFLAEAETVAHLDHPHIVKIHEIGEHGGLPFLSLEFIEGGPLSRKLNGTPQPPRAAARFAEILARAIHFAHANGVVHRDLKPGNILLQAAASGQWPAVSNQQKATFLQASDHWALTTIPKISDFGLAKRIEGGSNLTATGAVLGTPSYMAPEQAGGDGPRRSETGPAADIYSLGAILYEMLTGRPPFRAATPLETVLQVLSEEPVPPRQLQSKVPRDLETICLKCLQKDPHKRYETAEALADDLDRYVNDRPILARPVGRVERTWRWCRRNPVVASLSGLIAAGVLVAAALLYQERSQTLAHLERTTVAERDKTEQLRRAEEAVRAQMKAQLETTEQLRKSLVLQARAGRFSRQMGQRFDSLAALQKAAAIQSDPQQRDEAIACLALADLRPGPSRPLWLEGTKLFAFDGSYRRYARADAKDNITIRAWDGDREIRHFPPVVGQTLHIIEFSPDGACLLIVRRAKAGLMLQVCSVETGREIVKLEGVSAGMAFSPDSRTFAVQSVDGIVHVMDLTSGEEQYRWQGVPKPDGSYLAFRPDGRCLALINKTNVYAARVHDTATGQIVSELPGTPLNMSTCLAWHPEGERLAIGTSDGRALIFDVPSKRLLATLVGHAQHINAIGFHPGGDLLATHSWDGNARLWNASSGRPLLTTPWATGGFSFSTDGTILGYNQHGSDVQFVEVAPGLEYRTIVSRLGAGKGVYREFDIHCSGNIFAVGMDDGVRFWEVATGRELAHLPAAGLVNTLFFQPDGKAFITCGNGRLLRWPFLADVDRPGTWRIGAPEAIGVAGTPLTARSPDGHTLTVASKGPFIASIVDLHRPDDPARQFSHASISGASLSPAFDDQGRRWLVSAGWHSDAIKVWNAQSGKLFKELPPEGGTLNAFAPDGKTFINSRREEFCFYDTATWQPIRQLRRTQPGYASPLAFSADGRIVALEMAAGILHLVDVACGRTLAKLEDPNHDSAGCLAFTRDGTRLVVSSGSAKLVHVWDLRAIRDQLRAMGLDWEQDPFPAATQRSDAAPLTIENGAGSG